MKDMTVDEILSLLKYDAQQGLQKRERVRKGARIKELITALQTTTDPYVRRMLCDMMGDRWAKTAVPSLIECLNDPSADVRYSAADALEDIGSPAASESMLFHFMHEKDASVRGMLAEGFRCGSAQACYTVAYRGFV